MVNKNEIHNILEDRFKNDTYKSFSSLPSPSRFKDITKGAKRVATAIREKQKIAIVGDYDVDGVVSSAIIALFLDDLQIEYSIKIPNRFIDGYGISPNIVDNLDADVIITVDNGITAFEAGKRAKEKNIDLIITDHHSPKESLPEAYAIIDPKQDDCKFPFEEVCGAHVAWYFIAAIKQELKIEYDLSKFLDILTIAIIADMMDLVDLNRLFLARGIKLLNSSRRPAIRALRQRFSKTLITFSDIAFLLAPLLNSAGRMDDAILSYYFLKSPDVKTASQYLEVLIGFNDKRKSIEKNLVEKSIKQVNESDKAIVVWGSDWHEGVIGIVASRLSRKFQKPAFVFSVEKGIAKGSVRSVGAISILDLLEGAKDSLIGFGGHPQAAGVRVEEKNLKKFKKLICQGAEKLNPKDFLDTDNSIGEISPSLIDLNLVDILENFEPYGQKNPAPYFLIKDMKITAHRVIGKDKNHLKLSTLTDNGFLDILYFNFEQKVTRGAVISAYVTVSKNEYMNKITPQLMIKEILEVK